ncbi:hypothetical protein [Microbacterium sp. LWO12-1.2]|uniref:hypothetical protein n=1 Tax=Microbacterium sp. LWO12-1.2 TaxID=3135261 RepID=UPI0034468DC2
MTKADETADKNIGTRRSRRGKSNHWLTGISIALSVLALVVSSVAAVGTWAQVQVMQQSSSEKLVVMAMTAGVLDADYPDAMGEPDDHGVQDIDTGDTLSVWMDVANNGRAAGSITEMSYLAIGEQAIPITSVMCGTRDDGAANQCSLPLAMEQGEQLRIRVDFDEDARRMLNCPDRISHLFLTLTDSSGIDVNVGVEYEEPAWDCSR